MVAVCKFNNLRVTDVGRKGGKGSIGNLSLKQCISKCRQVRHLHCGRQH